MPTIAKNIAMPKNNARFILTPPTKQVPYRKGFDPNQLTVKLVYPSPVVTVDNWGDLRTSFPCTFHAG